jgi:formate hydrogenlyase subunit 4
METLIRFLEQMVAVLILPPFCLGIIAKTKAVIAGRKGPPVFQLYYDLVKLLNKGAVYSEISTWMFRLGPVLSLAAFLIASLLVPLGSLAPIIFPGDAIFFVYLLGLGRFITMAAALDVGSSFEAMGASREATFSSLVEPALILAFAGLALATKNFSLNGMFSLPIGRVFGAGIILAVGSLFIALLAENSRIPIDDPATHLELTMIHEVMILDHGGPDLAFILYGAAIKLFLMSSLIVRLIVPVSSGTAGWAIWGGGMIGLSVVIGVVESSLARLRLLRVPQLLVASVCIAAFAVILILR